MNKVVKNGLMSLVALIALMSSVAVNAKADLGVDSYTAVQLTLSNIFKLEMGTVALYLNLLMVLGQVLLLRSKFAKRQYFQIVVAIVGGVVINFVLYRILGQWDIADNYALRFVLCIASNISLGIVIALILALNFVRLPLEGFCLTVSEAFPRIKFVVVRQLFDIAFVVFAAGVSYLVFGLDWEKMPVREGTIISTLILPKIISDAYHYFYQQKWVLALRM